MDLSSSSASPHPWRGVDRPGPDELLVSEVFGPTIQGEGPSTGRAAAFVRLGGCNLSCAWCDTGYTWDPSVFDLSKELQVLPTSTVADLALRPEVGLVVITGGEPALQAIEAAALASKLRSRGRRVELETSGTIALGPLARSLDLVVVSPKLRNSDLAEHKRLRWPVLASLAALPVTVFKFVVEEADDLEEVAGVANRLDLEPARVWVMPQAREPGELVHKLAALADPVASYGWSLSGRLQILLWPDERGR